MNRLQLAFMFRLLVRHFVSACGSLRQGGGDILLMRFYSQIVGMMEILNAGKVGG